MHLVRYSLNYVSWKLRKTVAANLRTIYTAATVEEAEIRLDEFEDKWGADFPSIIQSWRRNWARIIPFFAYPPEIRRIIYTTNAIESVNMSLRKITKNRAAFPSDEAVLKLFYLALMNISRREVAIFAKVFMGIPAQQAAKNTRPLMPAAAPAVCP